MIETPWRQPPLTKAQTADLFMLTLADDTEDAPWMVMGDLQFWSASGFAHSLRNYAHEQRLPWYVAAMLPILYEWPFVVQKKQLSPDCFVALVPDHPRTSYDLAEEGVFPAFVLEVVSPSSTTRDEIQKRHAYELLGAREYALFTPRLDAASTLAGYRRNASGVFEPWPLDAAGRLWSDVLGLHLTVRDAFVQAETPEGRVLLTPEQAENARLQAEDARLQAEDARLQVEEQLRHEARARAQAEAEIERLRRALERYQQGNEPSA